MSYSQENGYIPTDIETIMGEIMDGINTQFGTTYTMETFVGTNFYKYFYALAQRYQANEVKTSEIFQKLQGYFTVTNAKISRPVVTAPGLVEKLETEGWIASLKPMIEADAGKINCCVDVDDEDDDYEDFKDEICEIIKDSTAIGCVTLGAESETIVLSNGQAFDYKFHLPERIPVWLRLTITISENNQIAIGDPDATKELLLANIAADYRLGKNFAPQRYFGVNDAEWASVVLLEWTDDVTDGELDVSPVWNSTVFDADFDQLFTIDLSMVTLVET